MTTEKIDGNKLTEKYRETISKYAKTEEYLEIANGSAIHATFLLQTFFENAKEKICIYTRRLHVDVFDNYDLLSAAKGFLEKNENTKILIAFQKADAQEEILGRSFIKELAKVEGAQQKLELWDANTWPAKLNHFAVMDDKAFRYELNHDQKEAVANFGDKKSAKKLSELFNFLIKSAEKIPLPSPA